MTLSRGSRGHNLCVFSDRKDIARVKGISEIALPQILRGFLQRVAKAIEITTIVAIEEIVMSAITTTFVTAIVWGEFRFPPHDEGVALLGVLRSAGFCKGAPLKVLSLGKAVDWDRDWTPTNDRSISTLHH